MVFSGVFGVFFLCSVVSSCGNVVMVWCISVCMFLCGLMFWFSM